MTEWQPGNVEFLDNPWDVPSQPFPAQAEREEQLTFLLDYALLAPSSHNTQPWQFKIEDGNILLFADKRRWLKIADPDQRELHISVGCALQNLIVAAHYFGFAVDSITYFPNAADESLVAVVSPEGPQAGKRDDEELFAAIPMRRTNREAYNGQALVEAQLQRLRDTISEDDLHLHMTGDASIRRRVEELIVRADAEQFADPRWRKELGYWMGQGVFGTPWLISKMSRLAVTYLNLGKVTAKQDSELLLSSPVLAVLSSDSDSREIQVRIGQSLQRLWLTATTMGISLHPMNQILQIPELKEEVARLIPLSQQVPQLTFRLGYSDADNEPSPRRPLAEVLQIRA